MSLEHAHAGSRRPPVVTAVLLVLAVLGFCTLAAACSTATSSSAPPASAESTESPEAPGKAPEQSPDRPLKVAFLGDSYVAGNGAQDQPRTRWTARVSQMWGWTEVNLGLGGTGYTTPGPEEKATTYLQRVDTVKEADPDAIVVFGGRNDLVSPIRRIRVAAGALFRELRRLDGSPDVVVVAPLWDASKPPKSFAALTAAIRDAARDAGVDFVPVPQQPLAGRPQLMAPDGLHPNADGYRVIAQFLAPRLKDAITGR